MQANTRRKNGALGATNLECFGEKSYQRSSMINTPRFDGLKLRLIAS
jgi:hypothetical protein